MLAAGTVLLVFGHRSAAIPGTPAGVKVDLAALTPFMVASVIFTCLTGSMTWAEQVSARALRWPARFLFLGLVGLASGVLGLAGGGSLGWLRAVLLVRTLLLVTGLAVISARVVGRQAGPLIPLVIGLVLFMFGSVDGVPRVWALPLKAAADNGANVISLLVLLTGVLCIDVVMTTGRSRGPLTTH